MSARRAFVTGITGQDGGYLAEQLLREGYDVHALAHVDEPPPELPGVTVHRGDITDVDGTRRVLMQVAPHEVYNLAGVSSVARSWAEPELTARVNGLAAAGLLETAWQLQESRGEPVRFVQASSAEIFGSPDRSPQDESTPVRPINPYGAAKAFAHHLVGVYRSRGLHATSAILYNHESPRRPQQFVTRKITSTVAAIAQGRADKLALGNLEARRDWGWAPDYVDAMVRAARAPEPGDFVVATGESHSVRDFAAAAFAAAGVDDWERYVVVESDLTRPADAADLRGDASRAADLLGWRPSLRFEEVVAAMVRADLGHAPA